MGAKCVTPFYIHRSYIAKYMLWHVKPQILVLSKDKIGEALVYNETKISRKFHEIPSSYLGGVADANCVLLFDIYVVYCRVHVMLWETPNKYLSDKIGGAHVHNKT